MGQWRATDADFTLTGDCIPRENVDAYIKAYLSGFQSRKAAFGRQMDLMFSRVSPMGSAHTGQLSSTKIIAYVREVYNHPSGGSEKAAELYQ